MWQDGDVDLRSGQDTSISGQFPQQWALHTAAQEAAPKEVAKSTLMRLLVRSRSFARADVAVGDSGPFHNVESRGSTPRRRGPAVVSGIAEAAAAVKFQGLTFTVARYCKRQRVDPKDVGDVEWHPASMSLRNWRYGHLRH